ncbi:hypothetical protein GIY30_01695 [Gordonia sp. HNM0687]|uniref:Glycosyltransferase RgtA/B/C/D-like domain-containing protein n=1 Tax=Gordonia mangrovi TaxID=2665643 RepID=A0A6L7GKL9_9ACTN|nr:hypothetical protein [Gordonia mangrovi]MXP20082.1 hypothetical protein [Gordonia mangrovi]UVF79307.1 hypothetical protein NWF22_05555 [Gordonia mangrovi]
MTPAQPDGIVDVPSTMPVRPRTPIPLGPPIAAASGAAAVLSLIPLPAMLRLLLVAPMLIGGLGTALTWPLRLPSHLRLALFPALGLAAPIGVATGLLWLGRYSPTAVTLALATVCLLSGGWGLRRRAPARTRTELRRRWRLARPRRRVRRLWSSTRFRALTGLLALWAVGLVLASGADVGLFGLMFTPGGLVMATALVGTVIVFVWCVITDDTLVATSAIAATIVIIRFPVSLLTEVPIYAWTYKHIGLVDFVGDTGSLPPSFVDIYTRWPGFFAGAAWFSAASGTDPVDVAHWFAPVMHVLLAAAIWGLARALGLSVRAGLIAVMCAELVNWVGQDYYAPQSVALVLAVTVIALFAGSRTQTAAAYFAIPLMGVIAVGHQLTPVWVLGCGGLLTLLNRVRPIWLIAACGGVWLAYILPRLSSVMKYGLFTGSNPLDNAKTNIGGATGDSVARSVTEAVDRGVAFAVWFSAAAAFVYLWRRGNPDWALPVVAFSPILLLAGQSYGGEAIFRVFLYSLVGCSILVGAALAEVLPGGGDPDTAKRRPRLRTVLVTGAIGVVAVGAFHGYYSGWAYNVITRSQVTLSQQMLAEAEPSTVIVRMAPAGWPERPSGDYVRIAEANPGYDRPLVFLRNSLSRGFPTDEDIDFLNNLGRFAGGGFYMVLPRQMSIYSDYFGYFRSGAIESLVERLDEEPNWRRDRSDPDTIVFRYEHVPTESEPW